MDKKLVDDLKAARKLIEKPEDWASEASERYGTGKRCAIDAICNIGSTDTWALRTALVEAIPPRQGMRPWGGVSTYNDHPTTTHNDILALFDRAIAAAEVA